MKQAFEQTLWYVISKTVSDVNVGLYFLVHQLAPTKEF